MLFWKNTTHSRPNPVPQFSGDIFKMFWMLHFDCSKKSLGFQGTFFNHNLKRVLKHANGYGNSKIKVSNIILANLNRIYRQSKIFCISRQILSHVQPFCWDHHRRPVTSFFHHSTKEKWSEYQVHVPVWTITT